MQKATPSSYRQTMVCGLSKQGCDIARLLHRAFTVRGNHLSGEPLTSPHQRGYSLCHRQNALGYYCDITASRASEADEIPALQGPPARLSSQCQVATGFTESLSLSQRRMCAEPAPITPAWFQPSRDFPLSCHTEIDWAINLSVMYLISLHQSQIGDANVIC